MDLVGAYDEAADIVQRRAVVLGLALALVQAKRSRAMLEAWLIGSVIVNLAAVGALAGAVTWSIHH